MPRLRVTSADDCETTQTSDNCFGVRLNIHTVAMSSSFYIVLPSNASMKIHPNNTLTDYTVELPYPVHLDGKYEVGLHSLEYTRSWNNIKKGENRIKISINGIGLEIDIEEGFYASETDLIEMLNYFVEAAIIKREKTDDTIKKLTSEMGAGKYVYFDFDKRSRHVTLFVAPHTSVALASEIAAILGFEKKEFGHISEESISMENYAKLLARPHEHTSHVAAEQVDYHRGLHMLYVYCDIVTGQIVGDVWANLIKTVPVGGEHGENVMKEYISPQYIPVLTNQFSNITITIRDDTGEKISFERGRVTATLHFRRQSEL